MKKILSPLLLLSLALGACAAPGAAEATATIDVTALHTAAAATALFGLTQTAAFASPTPSPAPTETPIPPSPTATIEVILSPVEALCLNNATVRSEPRKSGDNLGGFFYNQTAKVYARNNAGTWFYIAWQDSPTGKAWVLSKAFELKGDITALPIVIFDANDNMILLPPVTWQIQGEPLPLPPVRTGGRDRPATITQSVYVRVCPSIACMTMGVIGNGQQVNMIGRYGDNEWALIEYPSGPGGTGWVIRDAIQTEGYGSLPYYNVLGTPITPEPPTPTPDPNATPTFTPSPQPTAAGAISEVTGQTTVYTLPYSASAELGVLNPKDEIYITGIAINGLWYQIQYPLGTESRAYVSQKYIRVLGDMRYLPYFDDQGNLLPTAQP